MSYHILTDSDLADSLQMPAAIKCMEEAFKQNAAGELIAPERIISDLEIGKLVFTVGASRAGQPVVGFRAYDFHQLSSPNRSEVVAVFSAEDGSLRGLVIGPLLGAVRTGAIGGVAVKHLSRANAKVLGMIGTGFQAATQLEAALAARKIEITHVYSRDPARCREFAEEMGDRLDIEIFPAVTAEEAVQDADVVITTTTSSSPVLRSEWLKAGVHINNVGPKFKDACEIGFDVAEHSACLVTDTIAQLQSFGERFILQGTPLENSVLDLADIVSGKKDGRTNPKQTTLFYSLGLAGTEVLLANSLLEQKS